MVAPQEQAKLLATVCEAARAVQWDVVVNARIDAVMNWVGSPTERLQNCLRRARHYSDADCVYTIMLDGADLGSSSPTSTCP